jgi:hypothetical protein
MKIVELEQVQHEIKIGQECPTIIPNIKEDCIFMEKGVAVGFFLNKMPEKAAKLAELADFELRGKNVPKSSMKRSSGVEQFSCIIGSIPPKPHMRRPYPAISSVHSHKSAKTFIKAMIMLGKESEQIIKDILPAQHEEQMQIFSEMDDKWKLGNMFTSSISNYNISAPFHRDTGNIKNTVNVIITKRKNSTGGNLHIPDYNATVDQCDGSMLVYPAWRNVHGVTPITATHDGGYRNSLVFYPLKAFLNV